MIDGVLPAAREIADLQVLVPALAVAALAEQASGNQPAALELADEYEAAVRARPGQAAYTPGWWFLADLVRVCVAAGELQPRRGAGRGRPPGRCCGISSAFLPPEPSFEARGELHQAAGRYAHAARGWQAYGHVLEHGQALLGLGRCRLALREPGTEQTLTEARLWFAQLKAAPLLAEADRWLGQALAQTS